MPTKLNALLLLILAPMMWAGNAVVARAMVGAASPMMLNFLRWFISALILLAMCPEPLKLLGFISKRWYYYCILGFLGMGAFNGLQYLALKTSSAINVTLILATVPLWSIFVGKFIFAIQISKRQVLGALISLIGVIEILTKGHLAQVAEFQFMRGDLLVLLAAIMWAFYSWLLILKDKFADARITWIEWLLAQVVFGMMWSGILLLVEIHWAQTTLEWTWSVVGAVSFVSIGATIVAFYAWTRGVAEAGPNLASVVYNFLPVFAALLSFSVLGEQPRQYHFIAFGLIVLALIFSYSEARHL